MALWLSDHGNQIDLASNTNIIYACFDTREFNNIARSSDRADSSYINVQTANAVRRIDELMLLDPKAQKRTDGMQISLSSYQ